MQPIRTQHVLTILFFITSGRMQCQPVRLQSLMPSKSLVEVWLASKGKHLTQHLFPDLELHKTASAVWLCFLFRSSFRSASSYTTWMACLARLYSVVCSNPIEKWELFLQITHFINICGTQWHPALAQHLANGRHSLQQKKNQGFGETENTWAVTNAVPASVHPSFTICIPANLSSLSPEHKEKPLCWGIRVSCFHCLWVRKNRWAYTIIRHN